MRFADNRLVLSFRLDPKSNCKCAGYSCGSLPDCSCRILEVVRCSFGWHWERLSTGLNMEEISEDFHATSFGAIQDHENQINNYQTGETI